MTGSEQFAGLVPAIACHHLDTLDVAEVVANAGSEQIGHIVAVWLNRPDLAGLTCYRRRHKSVVSNVGANINDMHPGMCSASGSSESQQATFGIVVTGLDEAAVDASCHPIEWPRQRFPLPRTDGKRARLLTALQLRAGVDAAR